MLKLKSSINTMLHPNNSGGKNPMLEDNESNENTDLSLKLAGLKDDKLKGNKENLSFCKGNLQNLISSLKEEKRSFSNKKNKSKKEEKIERLNTLILSLEETEKGLKSSDKFREIFVKIITDLENFKSPKTNNDKKKEKENDKYRKIKKVVRLVERSVNQIIDEVVKSNSQPSKIENSTVAMTPASNSVNENKKNDMATSPFVFYTPVPLSDFEKKDYFSDANSSNSVASLNSFSQLGYNFSTDETGFNSPQVINNTFPDTLSELLPSCTPEEKTSKMLNEWGLSGILSPAYEEDTVDPNNINLKNSIICESTTDTDTSSETEEKSFNNVEEVKKYLIGNDFLRENQINFIEHLKKMVLKKQTDKKYDEANIYKSLIFFFLLFNHFSPQQFLNFLQEKKPSLIDTYKEQLKKNTMQNDIPQNNTKAATLSDNIQNFYHEASQFSALKKIDTENEQKKTNFFTSKTSLFKFFYPESKEDNKNPTLLKYFDGQAREVFKSEKIFSNNTLDNDLYKVYEEQYFSKLLK